MLAAALIFIATLVLVIWQPRGLGIGWSALGGAALALATGVIQWHDIPVVWHIIWDATFTFVGLIIISLVLDEAGFFHWAALHVARWGGGRGRLSVSADRAAGRGDRGVFRQRRRGA
ncbi:Arsenical pump membrane protein, partial [mine drainage metagenome]